VPLDLVASLQKQLQESKVPHHVMDFVRAAMTSAAAAAATSAKLETDCRDLTAALVKQTQENKASDEGLYDVMDFLHTAISRASSAADTSTTTTTTRIAPPATCSSITDSIGELAQESTRRSLRLLELHPLQWNPFPMARRWRGKIYKTKTTTVTKLHAPHRTMN
jgi:hypothetical protein